MRFVTQHVNEPTSLFDLHLAHYLTVARNHLPEHGLRYVETKVRQIHTERPDLALHEVLNTAMGVLEGELADSQFSLAGIRARTAQAEKEVTDRQRSIEAIERALARMPALAELEEQYPGRATLAQVLEDAGKTWADLGLTEADGVLLQQLIDEPDDGEAA